MAQTWAQLPTVWIASFFRAGRRLIPSFLPCLLMDDGQAQAQGEPTSTTFSAVYIVEDSASQISARALKLQDLLYSYAQARPTVNRLHELVHVLDTEARQAEAQHRRVHEESASPAPVVELSDVSLLVPESRRHILRDCSLRLDGSQRPFRLLIGGPSGVGKSTLLRALAGTEQVAAGRIVVPKRSPGGSAFMPQVPFLPAGLSLRDLLLYPHWGHAATACPWPQTWHPDACAWAGLYASTRRPHGVDLGAPVPPSDEQLCDWLDEVGLGHLVRDKGGHVAGLEARHPAWDQLLSGGEQARVALVRLLASGAAMAVLDEATAALDGEWQARYYEMLQARDMSFISVAHRPEVAAYHSQSLQLSRGSRGGARVVDTT